MIGRSEHLAQSAHVRTIARYVGKLGAVAGRELFPAVPLVLGRTRLLIARGTGKGFVARAFTRAQVEAPVGSAVGVVTRAEPVLASGGGTSGAGSPGRVRRLMKVSEGGNGINFLISPLVFFLLSF